jgi:hypothetical protein
MHSVYLIDIYNSGALGIESLATAAATATKESGSETRRYEWRARTVFDSTEECSPKGVLDSTEECSPNRIRCHAASIDLNDRPRKVLRTAPSAAEATEDTSQPHPNMFPSTPHSVAAADARAEEDSLTNSSSAAGAGNHIIDLPATTEEDSHCRPQHKTSNYSRRNDTGVVVSMSSCLWSLGLCIATDDNAAGVDS